MDNHNRPSFKDIPDELVLSVVSKILIIILSGLVFACIFKSYTYLLIADAVICLLLIASQISIWFSVLNDKVFYYDGILTEIKKPILNIPFMGKNRLSIKGQSKIYLTSVENDEIKLRVPVPFSFNSEIGSTIRVYSHLADAIAKNENTLELINPILVKEIKS